MTAAPSSQGFISGPITVPQASRQGAAPSPFRPKIGPAAGMPADGNYSTNEVPSFMIDRSGGQVRLRFVGSDEVFYLTSEPASLGGRVLRYDTGEIALTVAGWGGVTLYTGEAPWGVPADHQLASTPSVDPKPVLAKDIKSLADRLAKEVARHGAFSVGFSIDWDMLVKQADAARALAVDSIRNAAYALEQMVNEAEHTAIAKSLHQVRIAPSAQPGVAIQQDSLVISYAPQGGPSARPSSLAIAHALEDAF